MAISSLKARTGERKWHPWMYLPSPRLTFCWRWFNRYLKLGQPSLHAAPLRCSPNATASNNHAPWLPATLTEGIRTQHARSRHEKGSSPMQERPCERQTKGTSMLQSVDKPQVCVRVCVCVCLCHVLLVTNKKDARSHRLMSGLIPALIHSWPA